MPTLFRFLFICGTIAGLVSSMCGVPLTTDSIPLRNGDVIELAGTQMQFISR